MQISSDTHLPPQLIQYILDLESQPFEPPNNNIYASELDGCIRKSWYRRKYIKPPSKDSAIYLRNGTWQHENYQKAYKTTEQRYTLPLKIGVCLVGRADAINEQGELLEFKNVKNPYFLKKNDAPHEWDRERTLLYMWLGGYTTGHIYYFHAGVECNHFTLHIEDTTEDEVLMQTLEKNKRGLGITLYNAIQKDEPPLPLNKRSFDCNYCEYKEECIAHNNMGEKKI